MALVRWNRRDPDRRPWRIVLDATSPGVNATTANWRLRDRTSRRQGPSQVQSYGRQYFAADADSNTPQTEAVVYSTTIPEMGTYSLSAWWPILPKNNRLTTIIVTRNSPDGGRAGLRFTVDQRDSRLVVRHTEALPSAHDWYHLQCYSLRAGDRVVITVLRRSSRSGQVVADAFRLLKAELRIPVIPATQSSAKLPCNPEEACHLIQTKAATPSERSDA
jgi:hypothetical protein